MKLSAILTSAIVTGLISAPVLADSHAATGTDEAKKEKNGCKNGCNDKHAEGDKHAQGAKKDKNSCKNGCGEKKKK